MDYLREARIRYREVQSIGRMFQLILWGIPLLIVAVVAYTTRGEPGGTSDALTGLLPVVMILVPVWLIFRRLDITLDDENLAFGFWRFRPVVPLQSIVSAEPEKITFRKYGGIDIRWVAGAVCYTTRFGEGVRIKVEGRKRDWVFSCNDAPRLIGLLNEVIVSRPKP